MDWDLVEKTSEAEDFQMADAVVVLNLVQKPRDIDPEQFDWEPIQGIQLGHPGLR